MKIQPLFGPSFILLGWDRSFLQAECGNMLNKFINTKAAMKKLQFGTTKCVKLDVGKTPHKTLCGDLHVAG
jgi:hypothetical protein